MLVVVLLSAGVADAGRKRVVVLEFEGDKADKFHAELVKLIKKSHTVVSTDKWTGAAEELSATKLTDKNVKKVAKKLKVDGVISGTVEKRRDEYILRLKLRAGTSGELVGSQINIKTESTRIDGTAARDVKDELLEVIAELASNRGGGGGEDEDEDEPVGKKGKALEDEDAGEPVGKKAKKTDEDEDDRPRKGFSRKTDDERGSDRTGKKAKKTDEDEDTPVAKKARKTDEDEDKPVARKARKTDEDEDKPVAKKARKTDEDEDRPVARRAKKTDDEDTSVGADDAAAGKARSADDDESPLPKRTKAAKRTGAKQDGDEGEGEGEGVEAASDAPMDAARMYSPGERAADVLAGLSFTARRMSFVYTGTKPPGYKQNLPLPGILIDATLYPLAIGHKRAGIIKNFGVTAMFDRIIYIKSKSLAGMTLGSTEQRYAIGVAFRYPFNQTAASPVIGATLRFGRQKFTIDGDAGIPNVNYTIIDPSVFFRYPLSDKLVLNATAGFMAVTGTGAIQQQAQYGPATVTGFEGEAGGDYMLKSNLFARAGIRFETFGFAFKGTGDKSNMGAVKGARDTYFGGSVTAGYLF